MREPVRERAVVRQQQCAGRVGVEAADGDDARRVRDEADHRRASLRVARGRDDAGGLVQEDVGEPLLRERLAVEAHVVVGADERVELPGRAVHGDAAGLDQLVGGASGRHPGAREPCVQSHARIVARSRRAKLWNLVQNQVPEVRLEPRGAAPALRLQPGPLARLGGPSQALGPPPRDSPRDTAQSAALRKEQQLAGRPPRLEVLVRAARFVERIARADPHVELARRRRGRARRLRARAGARASACRSRASGAARTASRPRRATGARAGPAARSTRRRGSCGPAGGSRQPVRRTSSCRRRRRPRRRPRLP